MAQDTFISVALDPGGAAPDKKRHVLISGANLAGDACLGFDHTKIPDLNTYDTLAATFRQAMIGRGLK